MKKKLFCVTCLLLLQTAFFAAPVYQPVQAAKGGIRMSAPRSAPAVTAPKAAPKANTNNNASSAQSQTRNQTAAPRANANTTANRTSARGGAMRGIGLFAGGMFLGSMLSSLFGMGNFGWAADFLGLLFNVVLIYVLFKAVSAVWRAIRDRRHRS